MLLRLSMCIRIIVVTHLCLRVMDLSGWRIVWGILWSRSLLRRVIVYARSKKILIMCGVRGLCDTLNCGCHMDLRMLKLLLSDRTCR